MFLIETHKHPRVANVPIVLKCLKPSKIPQNPQTIGEHIKKRRLELKLLQREVANKLGVSEATIWNWEQNYTKPTLRFLPRVIKFLGHNPVNTELKTLGEKLLQYRKSHGIAQNELAIQLGIDPTTLSRLERSKEKSFFSILKKASDFLKLQSAN